MKKMLFAIMLVVSAFFTTLLFTQEARALDNWTGTITLLQEDGSAPGRGACVQMNPAISTSGGWACLSTSNSVYKEITSLLIAAYLSG